MRNLERPFVESSVFWVMAQDNRVNGTVSCPEKHCCGPMLTKANPPKVEPVGGGLCGRLLELSQGVPGRTRGGLGRAGRGWRPDHIEGSPSKGVVNHANYSAKCCR